MSPYIYVDESSDVPFGKYIKRYHEHDANQDISLSYLNLSPSIAILAVWITVVAAKSTN